MIETERNPPSVRFREAADDEETTVHWQRGQTNRHNGGKDRSNAFNDYVSRLNLALAELNGGAPLVRRGVDFKGRNRAGAVSVGGFGIA